MFQINDVISYGAQGVYKITAIERKAVGKEKKDYYVLTPVNEKDPLVFAPVDNPFVQKKMRRLLTQEEVHGLIDSMGGECALWIENENERKERYKSILSRGDHVELIQMIKAIYAHQKQREAEGKRLPMCDEYFFRDAEQLLYNEFRYVLGFGSKEELMGYIFDRIEGN